MSDPTTPGSAGPRCDHPAGTAPTDGETIDDSAPGGRTARDAQTATEPGESFAGAHTTGGTRDRVNAAVPPHTEVATAAADSETPGPDGSSGAQTAVDFALGGGQWFDGPGPTVDRTTFRHFGDHELQAVLGEGSPGEARRSLEEVERWARNHLRGRDERGVPPGWHWRDGIILHVLMREARDAIGHGQPELPENPFVGP